MLRGEAAVGDPVPLLRGEAAMIHVVGVVVSSSLNTVGANRTILQQILRWKHVAKTLEDMDE